jgi:hypothetical protein
VTRGLIRRLAEQNLRWRVSKERHPARTRPSIHQSSRKATFSEVARRASGSGIMLVVEGTKTAMAGRTKGEDDA